MAASEQPGRSRPPKGRRHRQEMPRVPAHQPGAARAPRGQVSAPAVPVGGIGAPPAQAVRGAIAPGQRRPALQGAISPGGSQNPQNTTRQTLTPLTKAVGWGLGILAFFGAVHLGQEFHAHATKNDASSTVLGATVTTPNNYKNMRELNRQYFALVNHIIGDAIKANGVNGLDEVRRDFPSYFGDRPAGNQPPLDGQRQPVVQQPGLQGGGSVQDPATPGLPLLTSNSPAAGQPQVAAVQIPAAAPAPQNEAAPLQRAESRGKPAPETKPSPARVTYSL
ncbi:MAG: hypothetical protein WDO70_01085 [Alphaproteobacteria bacterium]